MLDFTSISLNTATICCGFAEIDEPTFIPLSAIAIILSWFRLFYFLRVFSGTAVLVSMII